MKQMMYFPRAADGKRRGFTLTEIAIVLGVVGIIVGGIWAAADNVSETRKENDAVAELQTIVHNMYNLYGGRSTPSCTPSGPNGSADITPCLLSAQVIPSAYADAVTAGTAINPWSGFGTTYFSGGGGVSVFGAQSGSVTGPAQFRVSFYDVSYGGCVALINQATSCQFGEAECPFHVITAYQNGSCYPTPTGCSAAAPTTYGSWSIMTPAIVATLCGDNNYSGTTPSSVEFDYSLQ